MSQIQLAFFTPQARQDANVRANPNMFSGELAAAARVGDAVAGIGDKVADVALRAQQAINFGKMADAERQMNEGWALFQDEMEQEPDEAKWGEKWAQKSKEIEKSLGLDKAAPAIQAQMKASLEGWKSKTSIAINRQATGRQIERAKAQTLSAADAALKAGDIGTYEATVDQAAQLGLLDPGDAVKMKAQGPAKAAYYSAVGAINNDPIGTLDALRAKGKDGKWLNFADLDADDRLRLVNHAQTETRQMQGEAYQMLIERTQAGTPMSNDELTGMVEQGLLRPAQAENYKKAYHFGRPASAEAAATLRSLINNYDPSASTAQEDYLRITDEIATLGLTRETQSAALEMLKDKANPKSDLNGPAASFGLKTIDGMFQGGVYGFDPLDKKDLSGEALKDYNRAMLERAQDEDALMQYIKQNPGATREQVLQFIDTNQSRRIIKSVRAAASTAPVLDDVEQLNAILDR